MSAAASLTEVMERLGEQYTELNGVKVKFNLGGSTALAQQIVRGAPVDAFISAGPGPMDSLEAEDFLDASSRVDLLTNRLAVVGLREEESQKITDALRQCVDCRGVLIEYAQKQTAKARLMAADRVAIAEPDLAPAGRYAREVLQSLDIWEDLESRLVYATDVRAVLGYVETKNVDLGIVYVTDAMANDGVTVLLPLPEESHPPIVYPAAVLANSEHAEAARGFLQFLRSPKAWATFGEFGFVPIEED